MDYSRILERGLPGRRDVAFTSVAHNPGLPTGEISMLDLHKARTRVTGKEANDIGRESCATSRAPPTKAMPCHIA